MPEETVLVCSKFMNNSLTDAFSESKLLSVSSWVITQLLATLVQLLLKYVW